MKVHYDLYESSFGTVLIANSTLGICAIEFIDSQLQALEYLQEKYKSAHIVQEKTKLQQEALAILNGEHKMGKDFPLDLQGTSFQKKVWRATIGIPAGETASYGEVAAKTGNYKASRAVGTAMGANSIAVLVPCHRVVRSDGSSGSYRWGVELKKKLLAWERSQK